jgi:hypothetical protein
MTNVKGDSGMTDSQFMSAQKSFQDKHRNDMRQISRLAESAKRNKKPSWFSKLKSFLGIK